MQPMKRGGAAVRERNALRIALAQLPHLCADCHTRASRVEWNGDRYIVVINHFRVCPCQYSARSREACADYVRRGLQSLGRPTADYNDDLVMHR